MEYLGLALDGAWRVLLAGLLLGAGLPMLFALGVRSMAYAAGFPAVAPSSARAIGARAVGVLCFAVVVGVVLGLTVIVASGFGTALSVSHLYPTLVTKH